MLYFHRISLVKAPFYVKNYFTLEPAFVPVPPGRPIIHNERGILVESLLGPYSEGSELMLTCSVSGGKRGMDAIPHSCDHNCKT